jgi:hypothetical protein
VVLGEVLRNLPLLDLISSAMAPDASGSAAAFRYRWRGENDGRDRHSGPLDNGGHEPQTPVNEAYPDGMDVKEARPGEPSCKGALPYPAKLFGPVTAAA